MVVINKDLPPIIIDQERRFNPAIEKGISLSLESVLRLITYSTIGTLTRLRHTLVVKKFHNKHLIDVYLGAIVVAITLIAANIGILPIISLLACKVLLDYFKLNQAKRTAIEAASRAESIANSNWIYTSLAAKNEIKELASQAMIAADMLQSISPRSREAYRAKEAAYQAYHISQSVNNSKIAATIDAIANCVMDITRLPYNITF